MIILEASGSVRAELEQTNVVLFLKIDYHLKVGSLCLTSLKITFFEWEIKKGARARFSTSLAESFIKRNNYSIFVL